MNNQAQTLSSKPRKLSNQEMNDTRGAGGGIHCIFSDGGNWWGKGPSIASMVSRCKAQGGIWMKMAY